MNTVTQGFLFLSLLAGLHGCLPPQGSPTDQCSGTYDCSATGTQTVTGTFHRDATRCLLGELEFRADGTVQADALHATWTGDAQRFSIVLTDGTLVCTRQGGATAPSTGHCTGSPRSCSSGTPGYCSTVRGCYLDGSYDYYLNQWMNSCRGSAESCEQMGDRAACNDQGCDWR